MPGKKIKKTKKSPKSCPVVKSDWEVTDIAEEDAVPTVEGSFSDPAESTSDPQPAEIVESTSDPLSAEIAESTSDPQPAEIAESFKSDSKKRKKRAMVQTRSEASQVISEFHLTEIGKEKVKIKELVKKSKKTALNSLKSLPVPMTKAKVQKIKRSAAYEKVCGEVMKWDSVVKENRAADQIIYPLKKPQFLTEGFEKTAESFVTKHPIEVIVTKLLSGGENNPTETNPLNPVEEKGLQAMSLEEAKLRHNELMKHRALLSYQEAKARRQNKIKSKSYHRKLKREKLRKIIKEFEELQKVDAAAALEKIMEADKMRIVERMTLKHRNTGKWAKIQKLRAKYNPDAREVLKEDLNIGRQFKEKLPTVQKAIDRLKSTIESQVEEEDQEESVYEDCLLEDVSKSNPLQSLDDNNANNESSKPELADQWLANPVSLLDKASVEKHLGVEKTKKPQSEPKSAEKDSEFVDMEFISKATVLDSYNPSSINIGDNLDEQSEDDGIDNDEGEAMVGVKSVSEAFADEDLIAEFREEKKTANQSNKPQGIDLYLPGWGSWTGPDIKDSKQKRRRFFIQPPKETAKKNTLGSVIYNEDKDKKAAAHQVSSLSFPFRNVTHFESYIRQPVGHLWNPPSSFQKLNAPKVITKMGKVIQPIDVEDVVIPNTTSKKSSFTPKKPQKSKKRQAKELKAF